MKMRMRAFTALVALPLILFACKGKTPVDPPLVRTDLPWSLDVDLAGDTAFTALSHNVTAQGPVVGEISGRVNGLDTAKVQDTLYLKNLEYPDFRVSTPLAADGRFTFDAYDILGDLDGSHTLLFFLKFKHIKWRPVPDTLRILLDRS